MNALSLFVGITGQSRSTAILTSRDVVPDIDFSSLQTLTLQRVARHYFESRYAEPRDLFDLAGPITADGTFCSRLASLWPRLADRMRVLLSRRAVILQSGELAVRCASEPDEKTRRLIVKNCNDFLLHSAAGEMLRSIHPLMSERAVRRALRSMERVIDMAMKEPRRKNELLEK